MNTPLRFLLLLGSVVATAAVARAARIEVYLIGGQSNATGQGYVRNLSADFAIPTDVELFHSGAPHLDSGRPPLTWTPLGPASESPDRFGLELSLGRRLRDLRPHAHLAFIKHAHSGTNLHTQWNPGVSAADRGDWGPQFATFVATVDAGLAALRARGDEPVVAGLVWYQGEADASGGRDAPNDTTHAQAYAANFTHFIARVREQFHAPDLPVVYAVITPSPEPRPGRELVRQAQRDVAADSGSPLAVRRTWCVATDALPRRKDDPGTPYTWDWEHVGSAGLLTLGTRFAELLNAATFARVTNPEPALPIPPGPYEPTWASLERHWRAPQWFLDGKFGIFIHWGVYSVAARQSEWYPRHIYATRPVAEWHAQQFGANAGYKDLVPLFRAEHFDPATWADLFRRAGAKYVMPVAEHHDGFAMWDSALTKWDAKDMGPHRDLIGELAAACRHAGLTFGLSYHRMEHWSFMYPAAGLEKDIFDPAYADFYGPPQPPPARNEQQGDAEVMNGRSTPQSAAFLNEWLRRAQELVDKYRPAMIFSDNGVNGRGFDPVKLQFAAYYYNRAAQWGEEVALATKGINAKDGPAYLAGTVLDFERGHPSEIRPGAWQTDTTLHHRWGVLDVTVYRNAGQIIRELIDNVSKGGNLLLNIAPAADGTIAPEQQAILLEMGAWLDRNGESIYGTRPWKQYGEGPTQFANPGNLAEADRIHREAVGDVWLPSYTGHDWRFTRKGPTFYAIALNWPYAGATIHALPRSAGTVQSVELLGHGPVEFHQDDDGLHVTFPATPTGHHAYALKIGGLHLD